MGAKAAHPDKLVVDIDGDGSLLMNIQEMATCYCEKLPVKVMLLNNSTWAWSCSGRTASTRPTGPTRISARSTIPRRSARATASRPKQRYPDFVTIARGFGWDARHVSREGGAGRGPAGDDRLAGPFLLDVQVPYQEHVLPMIPSGMTVRDLIKE